MWQKTHKKQTDKSLKIVRFLCGKKIATFIYVKAGNHRNKNCKKCIDNFINKMIYCLQYEFSIICHSECLSVTLSDKSCHSEGRSPEES